MLLEGSCHCGAVAFKVKAYAPVPYMRCYCSICRKTQGGGGYAINLGANSDSLVIEGKEHLQVYRAMIDGRQSTAERNFCVRCGSALWVYDPNWPELVHPFASAIDIPLPRPPAHEHIMLAWAAPWVSIDAGPGDGRHDGYPDLSLRQWHEAHGLVDGGTTADKGKADQ